MKRLLALSLFALALAAPSHAQEETPGYQMAFTGTKLPASGYSCGRATYPIYCYGIPADDGGTFWLDVYWNAYPNPTGFIQFNNVEDLGQASITISPGGVTKNSLGQVSRLDVTFSGLTNDSDNDTYSGTASFTFTYVKMTSGSGRGGGYPGYVMYVSSYTMTIQYN